MPHSGRRFLKMGMAGLRQGGHEGFEEAPPDRNPGFFIIMTGRKNSNLWECTGSHAFVYYPTVMKEKLARTLFMEVVIVLLLSVLVGYRYQQIRGLETKWYSQTKISRVPHSK